MADDFQDFVKFDGLAGQAWYHQMIRDKRILRRAREFFTPERLFKSGEQGVWYDPSDTTTLFQDSAGTTPVTASGQPVGRMLDKSGRGNHATQPTAASRPIYRRGDSRGVVNLLRWSEDFSNAAWVKTRCTVTPNATTAPDGTMTADAYFEDATATASHPTSMIVGVNDNTGIALTLRFKKNVGRDWAFIRTVNKSGVDVQTYFDLVSGAVGSIGHTGASMVPEGNGWYTCAVTLNSGVAGSSTVSVQFGSAPANGTFVFTGEPSKGIYIWGYQLNTGPTALPYQRNDATLGGVATGASTDLHWLETDGVDDGMVTGNIDFTGTDKVSVFAGVRKLSDAAVGVMAELSVAAGGGNAGSLYLIGSSPSGVYQYRIAGTLISTLNSATYPAPHSSVQTLIGDIPADNTTARVNGSVSSVATDLGAGKFGKHPLYLFRRGGTTLPFNGWFYGLAITGRLTTDAETVATERFLAAKSAVVIP